MKMGQYDASIASYRRALELNPNFVPSHIGIATNLNFKEQHSRARTQLRKLCSIARVDIVPGFLQAIDDPIPVKEP